jgi:cell wall assembly regulator SMI1
MPLVRLVTLSDGSEAAMKAIQDRIETWLRTNAPVVHATRRPGASEQQIRAAEDALGVSFPEEVKAGYRIHDGCDASAFLYGWEWLSLERMVSEWKAWKDLLDSGAFDRFQSEPQGPIRSDWWHPAWIPLTYDGAGNHYCLDLAPGRGGRVGQIIMMWHDDSIRSLEADGFASWLEAFADALEAGEYGYGEEYGGLVPVGDL